MHTCTVLQTSPLFMHRNKIDNFTTQYDVKINIDIDYVFICTACLKLYIIYSGTHQLIHEIAYITALTAVYIWFK